MKNLIKLFSLAILFTSTFNAIAATVTFNVTYNTTHYLAPVLTGASDKGSCKVETIDKIICKTDNAGDLLSYIMFMTGGMPVGPTLSISNKPIFNGDNFQISSFSFRDGKIESGISHTQWDGVNDLDVYITFTE